MITFNSFMDAANAVMAMFFRGELPDEIYEAVKDKIGGGRPVIPMLVAAVEATYAFRDDADMAPAMRDVAAAGAILCSEHSQFGLGENARGAHIALLLRGLPLPEGAEPPVIDPQYAKPSYVPVFDPALPEPTPPPIDENDVTEAALEEPAT